MSNITSRYKLLFENNPVPMWVYDLKNFKFLEINKAALKKYGYSRKEFFFMNVKEIRPRAEIPVFKKHIKKILGYKNKSRFIQAGIWKHKKKNGEIFFVEITTKIIKFNKKIAALVVANDISFRKDAEDRLKFHSELLENVNDAVIATDLNLNVIYWNKAAEKFWDFLRKDIKSLKVNFVFQSLFNYDKLKEGIRVLSKTGIYEFETTHFLDNGKKIYLQGKSIALKDGKNNVIGYVTVYRDITNRKQTEEKLARSEELYRNIVETADEGIAITNSNWEFTYVNRPFLKMLGYKSYEMIGKRVIDFIFKEDIKLFEERRVSVEKALKERFDVKLKRKNNTPVWCSVGTAPFIDENKKFTGLLAMITDISYRKEEEEKLNLYNIKLKELTEHLNKIREDERNKISRNIHDHLGQQLNVLKIEIFLLAKKIASGKDINKHIALKELLSIEDLIDSSIKSIRKIVMDLRPDILEKLGLVEAIKSQAEEFEKRTSVICRVNSYIDSISFSREQSYTIYRIFQETLTNVAKHSNASKVDIELKECNKKLYLSVKDNGVGIKDRDLLKRQTFGIMGLKERVYSLNGKINIFGINSKGTKIEIQFPIEKNKLGKFIQI
jgi:PAS domain S-box-containing protein